VAVRRWDDEAKDPSVTPPEFGHFEALLRDLLSYWMSDSSCSRTAIRSLVR